MENPTTTRGNDTDVALEKTAQQRTELRTRHASALARLMEERDDLTGVHAMADLVSEGLRWSA